MPAQLSSPAVTSRVLRQDDAHDAVRRLLAAVAEDLLQAAPELIALEDRRPQRDRPSGITWRGMQTMCHVSALLASRSYTHLLPVSHRDLVRQVDRTARAHGLTRGEDSPLGDAVWEGADGRRLEVGSGLHITVRAMSGPFLPGSLHPVTSTSPDTAPRPLAAGTADDRDTAPRPLAAALTGDGSSVDERGHRAATRQPLMRSSALSGISNQSGRLRASYSAS